MRIKLSLNVLLIAGLLSFALTSCASHSQYTTYAKKRDRSNESSRYQDYSSRMPSKISTSEKVIVVNPNVHAWGAYDSNGNLIRAGLATAGANYCPDIHRRCHTKSGSFRVQSLGSAGCKSSIYPLPRGGAPMPYCMFFNGNQGLHGSYNVVDGNASHGCVRLHVKDAEWLRFNFVNIGTKVIIKPY
jgi:hypothetical protein